MLYDSRTARHINHLHSNTRCLNMASEYPSVAVYLKKSKHQFNDKNAFIASKSNEIIQKTLSVEAAAETTANIQNEELRILREQNKLFEKNLKQAKILLRKTNDVNMQKDLEIKILKQQLKITKNRTKTSELQFENHVHQFDSDEIKMIRSIKGMVIGINR